MSGDKVNILLVDDQPAKLLSQQVVLSELGENLLTAGGAREALEILLKNEIAVVLIDVCMPDTDGFELAAMIRDHPRFQQTAIIFISAILHNDMDHLRGYEMGAVDYVPVPIVPEVLRAKVRVFVDLYRKTRQLEQLNRGLEARVAERTAELASSSLRLREAEQLRRLALAAGRMGSWEWDVVHGTALWDEGQHEIFGVLPASFVPTAKNVQALIHPEDLPALRDALRSVTAAAKTFQTEFRVRRPNGETRWCFGAAAASFDSQDRMVKLSGVTVDITDRRRAEERLILLAEEVDHRARNVVTVIQAIVRLTRCDNIEDYIEALDGRIRALSTAHKLLAKSRWQGADLFRLVDEEIAPYRSDDQDRITTSGPAVLLPPATAQTIALALHELVTNAAKYGALSTDGGHVELNWARTPGTLQLSWTEFGGPRVSAPKKRGYGTRVITGGIESQLGGRADFDWRPEGLRCKLCVPYDDKSLPNSEPPGEARSVAAVEHDVGLSDYSGRRILLVEDEPMISMMLADMLNESGHEVDGPHATVKDAVLAATKNELQGGILDVNVRGEKVYAVADLLISRNVPFVFVTGYAADSIDSRFRDVPVLQKPIEPQRLLAALTKSSQQMPDTATSQISEGLRRSDRVADVTK